MRNLESIFDGAERTAPNPFREDVYASGITSLPGVTDIHSEVMTRCIRAFESLLADEGGQANGHGGAGRTLLLAAPRAGFGKSHLVGRVRAVTESLIAPVALPFDPSRGVIWETMLSSVFNQYRSARCPQATGCSLFEEVVRFFQSHAVRAAVESGVIDSNEIPESEISLRLQFREVFDPKSRNRLVPWLAKRSPEILDAVAPVLCQQWRLDFDDLVFWHRFFQDASRPKTTAFDELKTLEKAEARDRLTQFLRIASDCRPIAFLADHLDGFFGSDTAGMQIAEILTELRFAVPRSVTLLCLNEDVWESIFDGRIPSAWIDRLTGEAVPLREISPEEADSLLRERLRAAGLSAEDAEQWLRRHQDSGIAASGELLSPREVLREAAAQWDREAGAPERDRLMTEFKGGAKSSPFSDTSSAPASPSVFGSESDSPKTAPSGVIPGPFAAPDPVVETPAPQERSEPSLPKEPSGPVPPPFDAPSLSRESELDRFLRTTSEAASRKFPEVPAPPEESEEGPSVWRDVEAEEPDRSAAARAAGIDPANGLTNIDAIIADIRGQGGRAMSETPPAEEVRPEAPLAPEGYTPTTAGNQTQLSFSPSQWQPEMAASAPPPPESVSPPAVTQGNPFSAQNPEQRLGDLEQQVLRECPGGTPPWQPLRLQKVISAVGGHFSAVNQEEEIIGFRSSLVWNVRGALVRLGFEAPEHFAFWSEVLNRAVSCGSPGKVVLFSHRSAPFDFGSLAAMGADSATAMKYLDVIEISDADLARLYAAERFLDESNFPGTSGDESSLRVVAQRLDAFWRRIGKPLSHSDSGGE